MSMINPAMKDRIIRMELVKKTLEQLMPVEYKKALAVISMNTGLNYESVREYIKATIEFNDWIIKDGIIQKPTMV